jgi:hypothetical protein
VTAVYAVGAEPATGSNLLISEIHYHPAAPTAAEAAEGFRKRRDFEFLELYHPGPGKISLHDVRLILNQEAFAPAWEGASADQWTLPPGGRMVLAGNRAAFVRRYGAAAGPVGGVCQDSLEEDGGVVRLQRTDGSLISVLEYGTRAPWPAAADGAGYSLTLREGAAPGNAASWRSSVGVHGTPGSSETGNVHGMPLAALWGLPSEAEGPADAQWEELKDLSRPTYLAPAQTAWFGLRDVDAAERSRLNGLRISMHDVDRYGVAAMMDRFHQWLADREITHLWVSFDVDSLDPVYAPGTGTTVRGGLSYREAHLLAELLHEGLQNGGHQLAGVDIVEVNPLVDRNNETAEVAVEWVASLFGKAIL